MDFVVVNRAKHIEDSPVIREIARDRSDVDYRIEAIEAAFLRLGMVLPPAADVLLFDQLGSREERFGLTGEGKDFIGREHLAHDEEARVVVRAELLGRNALERRSNDRHGGTRK